MNVLCIQNMPTLLHPKGSAKAINVGQRQLPSTSPKLRRDERKADFFSSFLSVPEVEVSTIRFDLNGVVGATVNGHPLSVVHMDLFLLFYCNWGYS